jgi:hypothetical protein
MWYISISVLELAGTSHQWKAESQRATTLINKTDIALSTKAIKLNVGISTQSNNIPSLSYNLRSDRTSKAKEPPSSSERVTSYDANFDCDNPSLLPNALVPSSELILISYKVLSHRTANFNIKLQPSKQLYRPINADANFDRDNPSSSNVLPPSSEEKVSERTADNIKPPSIQQLSSNECSPSSILKSLPFTLLLESERAANNDTKLHDIRLQPSSNNQNNQNNINVQLTTALNVPPLSNNKNNINYNNMLNHNKASSR